MFDEKVSIFESFQAEPKSIPLSQWIKVCVKGSRYAKQVNEYRSTGRDDLKKSLPLVTVGALCKDGRKLENVVTRTGWIALDVDGKDNPHIKDAASLRDEIAKIVYVAFSGLSTGGKGVWCLVKVKHPDRQDEHFQQLIKDFKSRGIILDSTKGKNPNDARFYSYDPNAIVKSSFKIYDRLPARDKCSSLTTHSKMNVNTSNKYGQKALEDELNILSSAREGNRNNQLFNSAAALANLVAGGVLDEHTVKNHLFDAALSTGLKNHEIRVTLQSGFDTGLQSPRTPDDNNRNTVRSYPSYQKDRATQPEYEAQKNDNSVNLNSEGYPESWDDIQLEPGSTEYAEATRHALNDADDFERSKLLDPKIEMIEELFNAEPILN